MESSMPPRRPPRAAPPPQYRALELISYPATEAAARARLAGDQSECEWVKALPGDTVPAWLIDVSPGLFSKGRVEMFGDVDGEV